MTSIREQQRSFTRERLLEAGAESFARRGYVDTTIDDIAGTAGAGRATFYLHFKTKADVAGELGSRLVEEVAQLYGELDEVLVSGTRAPMRAWVARALDWTARRSAVIDASEMVGGETRWSVGPFIDRMPRWLARWPDDRRHEAGTRIALLTAQFRATSVFRVSLSDDGTELDRDDLVEAMTDIWLAGLRPPT